jgi:cytochrome oxidase Cu insertion factor (SCO1/SenC/PrrC family)
MLVILALLFLLPVALSFFLYYGAGWRPRGATNHGELIEPPRQLPTIALTRADGELLPPELLRGKWTLLYIGEGACDATCRRALYDMRQVRLSLNQNMDRVQRVFLYHGACCEQPYFADEQSGLIAAGVDTSDGERLLSLFPAAGTGRVYVVDPLGNLMMSYAAEAAPKDMITDLKRLLRLSHIG